MMRKYTIGIVGGGAAGALAAVALLRRSKFAHAIIIEPRAQLGRGVAYSTDCPLHLLNVPAAKMSAFQDQPDHFSQWLREHIGPPYNATSFVPRAIYGDYLDMTIREAQSQAGSRLRHIRALALDLHLDEAGVRIACSNGKTIDADALILATGNAAPAKLPHISSEARLSPRFFTSVWDTGATDPGAPDEEVLLLGTGLTALDAVLGLRHNGHRGTIHMVSRRGLLPHEHRALNAPFSACPKADTLSVLFKTVRAMVRDAQSVAGNWRSAIDGIRPRTNALWQALSLADQRRFLRHALPYWNVHRHRMAPQAAKTIAELMAQNILRILAGRICEITLNDDALRVPILLRGSAKTQTLHVGRVINCSGPELDCRKVANPLVESLLSQGLIAPHPLNVGIQTSSEGALIGADRTASNRLFAIGPARYGTLIETIAIPEIRVQAYNLAETMLGIPATQSVVNVERRSVPAVLTYADLATNALAEPYYAFGI